MCLWVCPRAGRDVGAVSGECASGGGPDCAGGWELPTGWGLSACEAGGSGGCHTPRAGPGARTRWLPLPHSHPLSHKDFSRWSLLARRSVAGNCSKRCRWRDSVEPRARGPARGAAPARGGRASPGTPGRAPGGQAAPPAPAFLRGSSLHPGALLRAAARLLRAPPPRCAVTRSLCDSRSADPVSVRPRSRRARSQAAALTPWGRSRASSQGSPGKKASVAESRTLGPGTFGAVRPTGEGAPRARSGRLPLFPGRPGGAHAPSPRLPRGARSARAGRRSTAPCAAGS